MISTNLCRPPIRNWHCPTREKQTLREWIADGAKYEGHWSFQRVNRPDVPSIKVDQPGWSTAVNGTPVMNEIDRFVAAALRERGLEPQPQANRERLIRRVYFDLTGLPPSIADIDSFSRRQVSRCL